MTDDLIQRLRAAHDMMATYTARSTVGADNWNYALHGLSCGDGKAVVEVLQEAIDQLVALQRERDKLQRILELERQALERWLPCPDCRDKYERGVCLRCALQQAESELVRLRAQRESAGIAECRNTLEWRDRAFAAEAERDRLQAFVRKLCEMRVWFDEQNGLYHDAYGSELEAEAKQLLGAQLREAQRSEVPDGQGRCSSCRWWARPVPYAGLWGRCERTRADEWPGPGDGSLATAMADDQRVSAELRTDGVFGCVQWEAQGTGDA
jgi:hypothetical protein